MNKEKGFVIYPTYKIVEDKAFVYLFGRLENGKSFVTINETKPYFFIREKETKQANVVLKKMEGLFTGTHSIEKTSFVNFNKEKMTKIVLQIPKDIPTIRKEFEANQIHCFEADVRFEYKFMMDMNISGTMTITGEEADVATISKQFDEEYHVDSIFINPKLSSASYDPLVSVLSFDIETNRTAKQVFSIATYVSNKITKKIIKEVLIVADKPVKGAISFATEKKMLIHFAKRIIELDPDIITGWSVIDFDLKVLQARFKEHHIPFQFGRINWNNRIILAKDFFKTSKAHIPGRMVVDGIDMLKSNYIKITDYKLDTAASEIINDRKLITETDDDKVAIIEDQFKNRPEELVAYNLKDAQLVINILDKKELIELIVKRSYITGMPLDRVSASVATLDSMYLREAHKRGIICSSVRNSDKDAPGKGGYVMEPTAGIFDHVLVLDFKSLYPSIMITFNIDPMSLTTKKDKHKEGLIKAPNGAYFRNENGILGNIIQSLWTQRDVVKKKGDLAASYAMKITMNSFYGALGNVGCRFFNMDITNAITYFGQQIIQDTAKLIEKEGYDVIYSDTDSVFVNTKTKDTKLAKSIGAKLEKHINTYYDAWVKKNFNRTSVLEIEYEKTYRKIIFPSSRGDGAKGAKKRYAGLLIKDGTEKMDFTGLEFVRRDWTEVSKKFQLELLHRVFHEQPVIEFVKKFVIDIKHKKYDADLVYIKAIRKNLSEYVKTTPPHVKAARKLDKLDSSVIKYIITTDGPEPIQKQEHEIDYDHYINKQIRPIADSILSFFNTNLEDVVNGTQQKDLFSF